MTKLYLCLIISMNFLAQVFADNLIEESFAKLTQQVEKSKNCLKTLTHKNSKTCSSVQLSKTQLNIKDIEQCSLQLKKKGYTPKWVSKEIQSDFNNSTKRAEINYQKKIILFKKDLSNTIDCLHELIHLNQQLISGPFEINSRNQLIENIHQGITRQVAMVEKLEKEKKLTDAQILANNLMKMIEQIKAYEQFFYDFDEIEAHHLIAHHCKQINCQIEDRDIAVSNLYLRRQWLSQDYQAHLERTTQSLMDQKKKEAARLAQNKWQVSDFANTLKKLFNFNTSELMTFFQEQNINIYRVKHQKDFGHKILIKEAISLPLYLKIPKLPSRLSSLSGEKIHNGAAFGKYICGEKSFILINRLATRSTLIHEYLHHLQVQKNPHYCQIDHLQQQHLAQFQQGKITRKHYEQEVLQLQATNHLAEYEVYRAMSNFSEELEEYDRFNNKQNLIKYGKLINP